MNQKLQEKYMEFQTIAQELDRLQKSVQQMQNQRIELETIKLSLTEIKKLDGENKVLIPLGGGIFGHGSIENHKEVIMNVGAGIHVKKDVEEARKLVEGQLKEFDMLISKYEEDLAEKSVMAQDLQNEIAKLSSQK